MKSGIKHIHVKSLLLGIVITCLVFSCSSANNSSNNSSNNSCPSAIRTDNHPRNSLGYDNQNNCFDFEEFATLYQTNVLPIVLIDTNNTAIPDEPKITAQMRIIEDRQARLELNFARVPFNYQGHIGIETRGSGTQWNVRKKQFAIETRNADGSNRNVSILGLPRENDWILSGLQASPFPPFLTGSTLPFAISRSLGHYSPRFQYVELFINGYYQGVYTFIEKIKRDKNRINISKMSKFDNSGDAVTGGYVIKIDKPIGAKKEGWSGDDTDTFFQYHYPKQDDITAEQQAYLRQEMKEFEEFMRNNPADLAEKIKLNEWIDYVIVNELIQNKDRFCFSVFLYKDRDSIDSRWGIGPVWDFSVSFVPGTLSKWKLFKYNLDSCYYLRKNSAFWWSIIWKHPQFRQRFRERWRSLRQSTLSTESLFALIDRHTMLFGKAAGRDYAKWGYSTCGGSLVCLSKDPPSYQRNVWTEAEATQAWNKRVDAVKKRLAEHLIWMDENLPE